MIHLSLSAKSYIWCICITSISVSVKLIWWHLFTLHISWVYLGIGLRHLKATGIRDVVRKWCFVNTWWLNRMFSIWPSGVDCTSIILKYSLEVFNCSANFWYIECSSIQCSTNGTWFLEAKGLHFWHLLTFTCISIQLLHFYYIS